jgi:predicted transposase YbfD/YdcC
VVVVRSKRTIKKTGAATTESRYYISSSPPAQHQPSQWSELIGGHWAGSEIRNHWKRDALMGEDDSRSRNPRLLANLALIRNALLLPLSDHSNHQSYPQLKETLASRPARCIKILMQT